VLEREQPMISSLTAIRRYKQGDMQILKGRDWLLHLALAAETHTNLERIRSLDELKKNILLDYVERTLMALDWLSPAETESSLIEEVLIWSEVAKGGMAHQRQAWLGRGYNLMVHNLGSARIYLEYAEKCGRAGDERVATVATLIATHGLVGQYIRGESPLEFNRPLTRLIAGGRMEAGALRRILYFLNYCIIRSVSAELWSEVGEEVLAVIDVIVEDRYSAGYLPEERLSRLRATSIRNGENFEKEFKRLLKNDPARPEVDKLLETVDLWYVEAALCDFGFEEFVKILLLTAQGINLEKVRHVSFERLMREIYYQYEGKKRVNIYKKRVIEKYLAEISLAEIGKRAFKSNRHVTHQVVTDEKRDDAVFFTFRFSPAGARLIDFCMEAEKADLLYEKAVVLLFDLFGLRKDRYDRFHEEEQYLLTMNNAADGKMVILEHVAGEKVLDIGPGGGVMLDLLEERFPEKTVLGIDIARNVLNALGRKKESEGRKWQVIQGDAFNLSQYLEPESIDTIIFSSIIHELFSYLEFEGSRFNHYTIAAALKSAFAVLIPGGRIIIRDGIMTEPEEQRRIIRFTAGDGMEFLKRYASDFKGRPIRYEVIGWKEVIMPVNDAMEFLYTYTWGEKSYVHEVNEQFGYFTPTQYVEFIRKVLGKQAEILECRHYLQDGYTAALAGKVDFFNEWYEAVPLPDSTCLIVIEKKRPARVYSAN
jgi:SAM-dependent methyltransferase